MKKCKSILYIGIFSLFFTTIVGCSNSEKLNNSNNEKPNIETKEENQVENQEEYVNRFDGIEIRNDNFGVPIICYHSVVENDKDKGPIAIPKNIFIEHIKTIKNLGYTTITLKELQNYLYNNESIPKNSVVLTFDDGYEDNYSIVYPILKEYDMKATMFVITQYSLDEGGKNGRHLNVEQIKEMNEYGIDIQSHTVSHFELGSLSYDEQVNELRTSKEKLEAVTGKEVNSIAYPVGSYNDETLKACAEAGYEMAFTIKRGYADRNDNKYELNRVCVDYTYKGKNIEKVLKELKK